MNFSLSAIFLTASFATSSAFAPSAHGIVKSINTAEAATHLAMSSFDDEFIQETPAQTQQRIKDLVEEHPVLLFMKGSKIFPQCGFSSTATQILQTYKIDFHTGRFYAFYLSFDLF
jgi:hypothetical protein